MFCKNCGKESEENQKFCTICGAKFLNINKEKKEILKVKPLNLFREVKARGALEESLQFLQYLL